MSTARLRKNRARNRLSWSRFARPAIEIPARTRVKKYCNFCGEPMHADAKECKQCGWDVSHDGPPTTDPGDTKARVGVAFGLAVAYGVMARSRLRSGQASWP